MSMKNSWPWTLCPSRNRGKFVFNAQSLKLYSYPAPNRFKKTYDQGYENPGYGRYSAQQQQLLHQQDQGLEQIGKNGENEILLLV